MRHRLSAARLPVSGPAGARAAWTAVEELTNRAMRFVDCGRVLAAAESATRVGGGIGGRAGGRAGFLGLERATGNGEDTEESHSAIMSRPPRCAVHGCSAHAQPHRWGAGMTVTRVDRDEARRIAVHLVAVRLVALLDARPVEGLEPLVSALEQGRLWERTGMLRPLSQLPLHPAGMRV